MGITADICAEIEKHLKTIPRQWDGKQAILEMKDSGYPHWKY